MTAETDPDVAMFACQVLGSIGGPDTSATLLTALGRPEINVRQAAVEALGRLKARDAVPALVRLLGEEPWLQLAAVSALGDIGDSAAVGALLTLVPDSFVAEPALDALRWLPSPAVLPALLPLLRDPDLVHLRPALVGAVAAQLESAAPSEDLLAIGRELENDHSAQGLWQFLADRLAGAEDDATASASMTRPDDRTHGRGGSAGVREAGALVLASGLTSLLPLVVRWAANRDGLLWVRRIADRFPAPLAGAVPMLLAHPDHEVRAGSIRLIPAATLGLDRLLALSADPEVQVRIAAVEALADLQDGRATARLADKLECEPAAERAAVIRALAGFPQGALREVLAPRLAEGATESSLVSGLAVLAETWVPELEDRVLELATAGCEPVRRMALRAAAKVPGSRAEVLLLRALADRDPARQIEALELLVSRGGHRVLTTLLALLGVADSLRYHVIRALGRLGAARAAAPLMALFPSAPLHEQLEILAALEQLGAERCQRFLQECLGHPQGEIRRAAARGLADLAGPSDLELFRRLARDEDWVMRSEAARALGRLQLPEVRPALLDLARDLEPAVARTARAALAAAP
jgi:HEAT repeat protein